MVTRSLPPPHALSVAARAPQRRRAGTPRRPPPARVKNGTCTSTSRGSRTPSGLRPNLVKECFPRASGDRAQHAAQALDRHLEVVLPELAERDPQRVAPAPVDVER